MLETLSVSFSYPILLPGVPFATLAIFINLEGEVLLDNAELGLLTNAPPFPPYDSDLTKAPFFFPFSFPLTKFFALFLAISFILSFAKDFAPCIKAFLPIWPPNSLSAGPNAANAAIILRYVID